MRSFGSIWNRSSPGSREATWRALAERSRNANSARLPCGTRTTALTLSAVPSNSRESMVRGCGIGTGPKTDGIVPAIVSMVAMSPPANAPIRFNIVPTASRRPPHAGRGEYRRQRGLGAVLHFDLGKHRRIPQHQRSCEHGICFPDQQRLSSAGPRRAQRHRAHPSGQRVHIGVDAGRIQTGPRVEDGHGTVFALCRTLPAHTRSRAGRGDDQLRSESDIGHDASWLAWRGQHHRHATEQSGQFHRGSGGADPDHAHALVMACRA